MPILPWILAAGLAQSPSVEQRGFLDTRLFAYPQTAPGDSGRLVGEALLRWEASSRITPSLKLAGSFDARTDSHRITRREWTPTWDDRSIQRPALALRRLSLTYNKGPWTLEAGRQLIRWGKADLLNPTDRFAPRDFANVLTSDFLGVNAARATYEKAGNTLDLVWAPRFTPSRIPLLNQRWIALPAEARAFRIADLGARYPSNGQYGVRYSRVGRGYEASGMFYEGFNHLPLFEGGFDPRTLAVTLRRYYPHLRQIGADAAIPLAWFTVKAEAAYFTSRDRQFDQFLQYVVQVERIAGEWVWVGGYAGEYVTERRNQLDFAPDRGLARTFLGRAAYTIDANRSVAVETAIRQNGKGLYAKFEYSQAVGAQWRATAGYVLLRGSEGDFLGQYRRNSHALLGIRYSF
jgi:hypothetical protein